MVGDGGWEGLAPVWPFERPTPKELDAFLPVDSPEHCRGGTTAEPHVSWVGDAWERIRPFSTGENYVNFQLADDDAARTADAYGRNDEPPTPQRRVRPGEPVRRELQHPPGGLTAWSLGADREGLWS